MIIIIFIIIINYYFNTIIIILDHKHNRNYKNKIKKIIQIPQYNKNYNIKIYIIKNHIYIINYYNHNSKNNIDI